MEPDWLFRIFSFALCPRELNSRLFPCAGPSKSGIVVLSPYHHYFAGEVDDFELMRTTATLDGLKTPILGKFDDL
jgi:hypothetical protein